MYDRVGGRENFYHCNTCCGCYQHSLRDSHTCLAGAMHRECAICLEVCDVVAMSREDTNSCICIIYQVTFDSLEVLQVMKCGHVLHRSCWEGLTEAGYIYVYNTL